MAQSVYRIKIPNAALVAAGTVTQWINRDGSLTPQAGVYPKDPWDLSMYDAWSLTAAVGSPGLTSAATGNIGIQYLHPNPQDIAAVAGTLIFDGTKGANVITGIAAAAFTTVFTQQQTVTGALRHIAVGFQISFGTAVTAGADLYLYLFGYRGNL